MLNGYKTYLSALALLAFAVYGLATNHLDSATGWPLVMEALALAGLRNAIK